MQEPLLCHQDLQYVTKPLRLSFRKMEKSKGDKFSPCLSPIWLAKKQDFELLRVTHDLIFWYRLYITRKNFLLISTLSNFFQSPIRQTLSKAFEKSTNVQYNFFSFEA